MFSIASALDWFFNNVPMELFLIGFFLTIFAVVISSYFNGVTIYRDYNDLALSCGVLAVPIVVILLLNWVITLSGSNFSEDLIYFIVLPIFVSLFIFTVINTFRSNNILIAPFVLITKLFLSFTFVINLYLFMTNHDKNRGQKAFITMILGVLLTSLVKENTGLFRIGSTGKVYGRK